MSAIISPASLQQMCQATIATWLTDWSGLVGQVSSRAALHSSRKRSTQLQGVNSVTKGLSKGLPSTCICASDSHQDSNSSRKQERNLPQKERKYQDSDDQECLVHYRKKFRKIDKSVGIHYDHENLDAVNKQKDCSALEYLGQNKLMAKQIADDVTKRKQNSDSKYSPSSFNICFDKSLIISSVRNCSSFFRQFLPPSLLTQVLNLAWKMLSRLVIIGSDSETVQAYQVGDWVRRAPILLGLCSELSSKDYPLNISGIPDNMTENILKIICEYFPLSSINSFVLPKANFKKSFPRYSSTCKSIFDEVLARTSLTRVILNSDLCDDRVLSFISHLSLKELEIGGSSVTEKGIISGLCALPVETSNEAIELIRSGFVKCISVSPLRKSLHKLDLSFQNLSSSIYSIILAVFSQLLYYTPHRNMIQCISSFTSMIMETVTSNVYDSNPNLKLLNINAGHASRNILIGIVRACPYLQELTLILDLNAEDTLLALEHFPDLSRLELTYYPASPSSLPKLNAQILQTVLDKLRPQLKSLTLRGFNIPGNTLCELSQLQELCSLELEDCWLSNPRTVPPNPFPSLIKLKLNFLPVNATMQFLTMGGNLKVLELETKDSVLGGNSLTDSDVKQLVHSGILRSLHSFNAKSSCLTLESLKALKSLPFLKSVGFLASWGLTEEELRCVSHSGPQHVLCFR